MTKSSQIDTCQVTVEKLFAIMNSGQLEDLDQVYDLEVQRHGSAIFGTIQGLEPFLQVARQFGAAFPDLRFEVKELLVSGDRAAVRWMASGTHQGELPGVAPTGREITWSGMSIYRIEGEKIAEEWFLEDTQGLLGQLGVA